MDNRMSSQNPFWKRITHSIRALLRRKQVESDLDSELRFHLESQIESNIRAGMSPDAARQSALRKFGGVELAKDECRDERGAQFLEQLWQDVRFGARMLRKNPGFTAVAVLTLALGIGANTAIFSVVEGVVLAPLPYSQPDRLVTVWENNQRIPRFFASYPDFQDWQRGAHSFQQMGAFTSQDYDLSAPGTPEHLDAALISADFLNILGVKPALGREFSSDEDRHGGAPAVIISDRLWKNRFYANPSALSKSLTLDGVDYTIVGILPPDFHFIEGRPDVFRPLGQGPSTIINNRTAHSLEVIARLKSGVTTPQAQTEMTALENNLDALYPATNRGIGSVVIPLQQQIAGNSGGTLFMVLGAAGLVLLIACANVASLLLARATTRSREFAIRAALGASRARVIRQLLTESVILSFSGGALGLAIAKWGLGQLLAAFPGSLPRSESIGVNTPVLFFTFAVSIAVGILFGLAPALKSSKADLQGALKEAGRGSSSTHHRAQSSLVVVQMALTLVLLVSAGLLFRTIRHLWNVNPGFDTQHVITFKVGLPPSVNANAASIGVAYHQLIERIREIPGVQSADFTNIVPLSGEDNGTPFWIGPQKLTSTAEAPRLLMFWTGADYLKSMGIPLLEGRFFNEEDTVNSAQVIVIDSALAHTYFPDRDPIGQTMTINIWGTARVIGVVGHVTHWGLDRPNFYTQNQAYGSFYQLPAPIMSIFKDQVIVVHSPLNAAAITTEIRNAVQTMGSGQSVFNIQTIQEVVSHSMSSQRFPMLLLGAFAVLALLLASVGIYGVISYSVTLRTNEIGIRMALGAEKRNVFRMVIGQGLRLAVVGLAIGAAAALILARLLSSFSHLLYGVGAGDPTTFAAVSLVLTFVAVLACYIPARRATRVDPMTALRNE
jgi:predicted permease